MATATELEKLALSLPEGDRANLATALLESLAPILQEDDEGVAEALRREAELAERPATAFDVAGSRSQDLGASMRRLIFHQKVFSDIDQIMSHYEKVASPQLADEFYAEFRRVVNRAASRPEAFAIRQNGLRRANLQRFPYHFLFRIAGEDVRVLVVRHHHRDPSLGIQRR